MAAAITSPKQYVDSLPAERKKVVAKLRTLLRKNLPKGFKEQMSYGMIGYVVPHSIYPAGYHVDPSLPLPFINLASQKSHVALYHYGIYGDQRLADWFVSSYSDTVGKKPDMGKSCIRFKKMEAIPYDLLSELAGKIDVDTFIKMVEKR